MRQATFTFTQEQLDWLKEEHEKTGLTMVEIMRRALDHYRDEAFKKEQARYFTPQQRHDIKKLARMQNISEKEVIRTAIDKETRVVPKLNRRKVE